LKRRSAVEPVIGHTKNDGHLGRNFLKGRAGDKAKAILSATGYNFRLILKWLRKIFAKILAPIITAFCPEIRQITAF